MRINWLLGVVCLFSPWAIAHDHDTVFHAFRLEVDAGENRENQSVANWDVQGWLGGDHHKLWLQTEGEVADSTTQSSESWALYSYNFDTFWDVQAGVRYDSKPVSSSYFVAGLTGVAPYYFETQAHLFVSDDGDVSARLHVERDVLFTQKLILQPYLEMHAFAQDVREQDKGSGVSDVKLGLQLRYEISRKFSPYLEINVERLLGETADIAEDTGDDRSSASVVAGLRFMF